jgi:hypothetical protein
MLACAHHWVKIKNGFCDTLKSKLQNIDEKRYHYMIVLGRAFGRPTLVGKACKLPNFNFCENTFLI